MRSLIAFSAIIFVVSFASFIDGRRCPGSYWKTVMKNEPMPEVISGLLHGGTPADSNEKKNWPTPCATLNTEKPVRDFDVRPNVIIYHSHHADSRRSETIS